MRICATMSRELRDLRLCSQWKLACSYQLKIRSLCSKPIENEKRNGVNTSPTIYEQIQSPPNLITLTRMASTPVLAYWIMSESYSIAAVGCVVAAASDYLDGYLAKQYGWSTVLGTYLDPLADKIFVNTIGFSLWYTGTLPTPLIIVWASKDILLLGGTGWFLYEKHKTINFMKNSVAKEPLKVTPSYIAKVNTTLQFATLGVGITSPILLLPHFLLDSLW